MEVQQVDATSATTAPNGRHIDAEHVNAAARSATARSTTTAAWHGNAAQSNRLE